MKRKTQKFNSKTLIIVLLLIICLIVGAVVLVNYLNSDDTPPTFTLDNESIQLTEDDITALMNKDYSSLLNGVRAYDDRDGDITDHIIVYSVQVYEDDSYATIAYRVLDQNHNAATVYRLAYIKTPMEIYEETLAAAPAREPGQGAEPVEEPAPAVSKEKPVIVMQSEITLKVGQRFTPQDYLLKLEDDHDTYGQLLENARMEGTINTNRVGVYPLAFIVTDSDGNDSAPATVTVTVEH